jgi:hypothetical protein
VRVVTKTVQSQPQSVTHGGSIVKFRLASAALLTATSLTGCALPGHLYPLQGPAATHNPPVIFPLVLNSQVPGGVTATLDNNESCTGHYANVSPSDSTAGQMSLQWDQVYGPGFFTANVLGNAGFQRAALTCKQGTTLNVEFFQTVTSGGVATGKGMGQDSKGNLYKLTFGN